jgi:hypothetical protein
MTTEIQTLEHQKDCFVIWASSLPGHLALGFWSFMRYGSYFFWLFSFIIPERRLVKCVYCFEWPSFLYSAW